MAQYGGNSAINLGDYAAWDDGRHRRAALGLGADSAEQHAADALAAGRHYGDPALVATMTRAAPAALDWMVAEGGLRLRTELHRQGRGAFRMHLADSGRDYVEALWAIGSKHGAALRTGAKLARIWRQGAAGPVVGVQVATAAGRRDFAARRAVVLDSALSPLLSGMGGFPETRPPAPPQMIPYARKQPSRHADETGEPPVRADHPRRRHPGEPDRGVADVSVQRRGRIGQ
jgi:hypothetical protein